MKAAIVPRLATMLLALTLGGGVAVTRGADETAQHFEESNFGVSFRYSVDLETSYNPHGGADRVLILHGDQTVGALLIRPAPPEMAPHEFVASGMDHFRQNFGSSDLSYESVETANGYQFHRFTGHTAVDGVSYVVERYVHLRKQPANRRGEGSASDIARAAVDSLAGAFVFEFVYQTDEADRLAPDLRKVVDSFAIKGDERPTQLPEPTSSSATSRAASTAAPEKIIDAQVTGAPATAHQH